VDARPDSAVARAAAGPAAAPDRATVPPAALSAPAPAPEAAPRSSLALRPSGAPEPRVAWRLAPDDRPRPPSLSTPGLDKGTARRLARGRREPEARLDLHGMTADRAHAALTRFVGDGVARGLRCLLVVTGMGRGPEGGHRGDGVLRRETPRWLGVAPLSGHVVGVFEAHARHGGAGALYVYLRRRR
jgi:DNA-nicking Smr family endonuclease